MTEREPFRILIADDNRQAANGLGKLLRRAGYAVDIAYGGMEALDVAEHTNPDIILLDISMPDMDGHETARRLRAFAAPSALIIAVTGYGQESDRERALQAGFDRHFTKPVGISELEEAFALALAPAL